MEEQQPANPKNQRIESLTPNNNKISDNSRQKETHNLSNNDKSTTATPQQGSEKKADSSINFSPHHPGRKSQEQNHPAVPEKSIERGSS